MPKALDTEKRELAKNLFFQQMKLPAIAEQVGVPLDTLKTWIKRYHWRQVVIQTAQILKETNTKTLAVTVAQEVSEKSKETRESLADAILNMADLLKNASPKTLKELGNSPNGEGLASIAKRISDAASIVHNWRSDTGEVGLVISGLLDDGQPEKQAIPCESEVVAAEG